ncbi:DEAD/DEAH box helicase [Lactobacillus helveticus]|uniref:DEAD/DEAH box helicase n=2 Tax=Lactobacillus TaxID=1578 RepID=UPI0021C3AD6E|nr:DEAD/DEAH box helicase [Lactobacillus helveticus]MDH5816782.1 DEAD/DEAH box helicase [Lactobacillus helveticus]
MSANIKIEENNGSANILVEDFPTSTLIAGTDKYYGYYKGVWIKYDGLTPKYLAQLGLHPGKELRFSKKNVAEFARKVLPKLEKSDYLAITGVNGLLQKTQQLTIEQLAQALHDLNISFTDFIHGKLQLPAYRSFYFAKECGKANSLHFSSNESFNQLIKDLNKNELNKNELKQNKLPDKLKNVLRPYQKEGFNWLNTLVNYNFGGILADEMGLGKTLQVISLLLAHQKKDSTNLVVAPASVIYNWQNEAQKFAPELKIAVLGGTKKERTQILANASKYDLLITSYQSLNRDLEAYQKLVFNIQILDEAQNIKNHQSITAQSVKVIKAHHKLALTGTPIENKLSELWSIFDYLMPNFLGSYLDFKKKFELPIIKDEDEEAEKQLVEMVTPFILRRLKKDVLNDLPAKEEEIVYVNMGSKQSELYKLQTQKLIAELSCQGDAEFKRAHFEIFAQITKLREICCDPHLLYENYHGNSGKLIATIDLIKANLKNGHKILLFSQFTSMLEIIQNKLRKLKVPIFVITGATAKKERQDKIHQFNSSVQFIR